MTDEYRLEGIRVDKVFRDCLGSEEVVVEGITARYGFVQAKLDKHRDEIDRMLGELPEQFHEDTGGGWSFLQACMDRHGNHWAEHPTMEQLFCLGMGTGRVACPMERALWSALPGGVPYYVVKRIETETTEGE